MLNCIQYDRISENYYTLGISTVNKHRSSLDAKEERDIMELDFDPTPNILREEYLDIYKGIQSEILNTTRFDECTCTVSHFILYQNLPQKHREFR